MALLTPLPSNPLADERTWPAPSTNDGNRTFAASEDGCILSELVRRPSQAPGTARFELRVSNQGSGEVLATAYTNSPISGPLLLAKVSVGPFSLTSASFDLRLHGNPERDRVMVEVQGRNLHLSYGTLPAPEAPRMREVSPSRNSGVGIAGALAAVAFIVVSFALWPFSRNPVAAKPAATAASPAPVAERAAAVAPPIAPAPRPRIGAFSVQPSSVRAGGTLAVAFATTADAGDVRLIDEHGTIWASQPIDHRGELRLEVPRFSHDTPLHATLQVRRGRETAETGANVLVTAEPAVLAGTLPVAPDGATLAQSGADGSIALARSSYRSGDPIEIAILRSQPHLHIAIVDAASAEIAGADPGDARRVTLPAPSVDQPQSYTLVATYRPGDGSSEESIVKPLNIVPR